MKIEELIKQRHSTRAFLDKPSEADIIDILKLTRYAPSGANTQPWQMGGIRGHILKKVVDALEQAFRQGQSPHTDYDYSPTTWVSPYRERRRACGLQLYQSLGIDIKNKSAQQQQWAANHRAFDAPVRLLFFMGLYFRPVLFWIMACFYRI